MKVSSLYGKKIFCMDGRKGYVTGVNFKADKITGFTCADLDENEFTVSFESVTGIKDKINCKAADEVISGEPLRLGKPVFGCDAKYEGMLTDITAEGGILTVAHIGKRKFPYRDVIMGDAVIIKSSARVLKSDVKKNGKIFLKRGTPVTQEILDKAQRAGEYVQTNLKTM